MAHQQNGQQRQQSIPMESTENHWRNVFNRYDLDKDGRIDLTELRILLSSNRDTRDIPARVAKEILRNADINLNGYLEFDEFLALVESEEGSILFKNYVHNYMRHVIPRRIPMRDDIPDGEYEDQYTCYPPAVGMLFISIVEIILFLVDVGYTHTTTSTNGPVAKLFIYNPYRREEAWRFLTYMFVHIGMLHLVVNILVQVLLGIPLEMVHRWWRVLIIYFAGVIAGSLATSLSDPGVFLAGASGGVYALITAHVATIIMNWSEMEYAGRQLLVFLVLAIVDIGGAIHTRYIEQVDQKIGYVAHLAGAGAGLLVGLFVLRNLEVHNWEKRLCRISVVLYIVLIATAVVWNLAYPDYFPKSHWPQ